MNQSLKGHNKKSLVETFGEESYARQTQVDVNKREIREVWQWQYM